MNITENRVYTRPDFGHSQGPAFPEKWLMIEPKCIQYHIIIIIIIIIIMMMMMMMMMMKQIIL